MQEHLKSKEAYKQFYEEQALNHGNDHLTEDYIRIQFLLSMIQWGQVHMLEIGCQTGGITKYVVNKLYPGRTRLIALDVSENYINKARNNVVDKRVEFVNSFATDYIESYCKYKDYDQGFSTIIATEVLEHVLEPQKLLKLCGKALRGYGPLLLTVPDENYVDTLGEHNTVFTEEKLNNMLKDAGFKNVFIFHKEEWYFAICRKG